MLASGYPITTRLRTSPERRYTPGVTRLEQRITAVSQRAISTGALVALPTSTTIVEDGGIGFVVHVSRLQARKALAKAGQKRDGFNPFLPPDPELLIGELPPGHVSVLNKFNVLERHLLIVTTEFEPQENLLDRSDFAALGRCMEELDGLAFYNGGTIAGASQPHKHLQLVPLPLGPGPAPTPLDATLPDLGAAGSPLTLPVLPFRHALIPLGDRRLSSGRADELEEHYRRALTLIGVRDESRPYNLLLTRRWMLAVPRSREHWRRVSINALGFAGSLLVRDSDELEELRTAGPLAVLRSVVEEVQP